MALHDLGYRHWQGRRCGIWRRRWTITAQGLRGCLANRWMRYVITGAWGIALVQVALLFCLGQLLVADSLVVRWSANLNPQLEDLVSGLTTWLEQHPEISVRTTQNLVSYNFSLLHLTLGLLAVTLAIPHLITRDLSSHAIIIYASKAVNRLDYLAGKSGVLFGVLTLTWLGPMLAAWIVGNLLAPDWHFFWHARLPLFNTLLFVAAGATFVSILGLAASAVSSKEKAAVGCWLLLWLVGNALVPVGQRHSSWVQHLSFHENLRQIAAVVYQPTAELERARNNIPVLGNIIYEMTHRRSRDWSPPHPRRAGFALALVAVGCGLFLLRRTRTE